MCRRSTFFQFCPRPGSHQQKWASSKSLSYTGTGSYLRPKGKARMLKERKAREVFLPAWSQYLNQGGREKRPQELWADFFRLHTLEKLFMSTEQAQRTIPGHCSGMDCYHCLECYGSPKVRPTTSAQTKHLLQPKYWCSCFLSSCVPTSVQARQTCRLLYVKAERLIYSEFICSEGFWKGIQKSLSHPSSTGDKTQALKK